MPTKSTVPKLQVTIAMAVATSSPAGRSRNLPFLCVFFLVVGEDVHLENQQSNKVGPVNSYKYRTITPLIGDITPVTHYKSIYYRRPISPCRMIVGVHLEPTNIFSQGKPWDKHKKKGPGSAPSSLALQNYLQHFPTTLDLSC